MAKEDSYEIMPYKEIVDLKKQITELQRKTGDTSSQELLQSMAVLTKSMNNMLNLFSSAAEEMKLEEKTERGLSEQISPLIEKVDRLEGQNKTIAEGLVAVADMVNDLKEIKAAKPKEVHRPAPKRPEPSPFEPPEGMGLPPLEPPRPEGPPMFPPGAPPFPPHTSPRVVPRGPIPPPGMPMPPPGMPMPPPEGPMHPPGGPMPPPGMPMPPPRGSMPPLGGPMPPPGADFGELPPLPPLGEEHEKKGIFKFFKKK